MKLSYYLLLSSLSILFTSSSFAASPENTSQPDTNGNGQIDEGQAGPPKEYVSGPCDVYCPVTKFKEECYYTTTCVDEPYTVRTKYTRYVPTTFTKRCCRMVPEYYDKEYCKKVPEHYYVEEQKCRQKRVREKHVRYVPYTEIRHTCVQCAPDCLSENQSCDNGED